MKKTPVIALMVATLMVTSTALAAPAPPQQGGGSMRAAPAQQHFQPLPVQPKPAMPRGRYSRRHKHHGDSLLAGMLGVVIGAVIGSAATSGN